MPLILVAVALLAALPAGARAERVIVEDVPGTLLDVQPDRLLYVEGSTLKIEDRSSGSVESVPSVPEGRARQGGLTSHGAVFVASPYDPDGLAPLTLYEWRDGAMTLLQHDVFGFQVENDVAIWDTNPIKRRDFATGVTTEISPGTEPHLGPNGDVVFTVGNHIARHRGGVTTMLTSSSSCNQWPRTDGVNVVYLRYPTICSSSSGPPNFRVYTAAGEDLALDGATDDRAIPLLAGGYVAYMRTGTTAPRDVMLRSPSGVVKRVSLIYEADQVFGASRLVAISPQGQVVFTDQGSTEIFLGNGNAPPTLLGRLSGGLPGTIEWQDGKFLHVVYGTAYEIVQPPGYPRPKSASPVRVSLVNAYQQCTAPNRTHGPPLAFGSCHPPDPASSQLTVGTADSNGKANRMQGSLKLKGVLGDPWTAADEADIGIEASVVDVYRQDLTDYTGALRVKPLFRWTDRENHVRPPSRTVTSVTSLPEDWYQMTTAAPHLLQDGDHVVVNFDRPTSTGVDVDVTGSNTFAVRDPLDNSAPNPSYGPTRRFDIAPATSTDTADLSFNLPCVATSDTTTGSTCAMTTSADAIVPGAVDESHRSVAELLRTWIYDAGPDGQPSGFGAEDDNTLFLTQGVFVP